MHINPKSQEFAKFRERQLNPQPDPTAPEVTPETIVHTTREQNTAYANEWRSTFVKWLHDNPPPRTGVDSWGVSAELEIFFCRWAMAQARNNRQYAGRLLGLNRTTLVERLKRYKMNDYPGRGESLVHQGFVKVETPISGPDCSAEPIPQAIAE